MSGILSPIVLRRYPQGVYGLHDLTMTTKSFYFVDSTSGSAGTGTNYGSPSAPWSSVAAAIASGVLVAGDIIIGCHNHVETISAAGTVAIATAGIKLQGVGWGASRPKFTFASATTADVDINAASIWIDNWHFDCVALDAVAAPLDVNAADFRMTNCTIELASSSAQATVGIVADGNADRMVIEGCYFYGTLDTGTNSCISVAGADDVRILNSYFAGAHATNGTIENTAAARNLMIVGNHLMNLTADGNNKVLVADASTTGLIDNNRIGIIDSTSPAPITAAGMYVGGGNYYVGAAGVGAAATLL